MKEHSRLKRVKIGLVAIMIAGLVRQALSVRTVARVLPDRVYVVLATTDLLALSVSNALILALFVSLLQLVLLRQTDRQTDERTDGRRE